MRSVTGWTFLSSIGWLDEAHPSVGIMVGSGAPPPVPSHESINGWGRHQGRLVAIEQVSVKPLGLDCQTCSSQSGYSTLSVDVSPFIAPVPSHSHLASMGAFDPIDRACHHRLAMLGFGSYPVLLPSQPLIYQSLLNLIRNMFVSSFGVS